MDSSHAPEPFRGLLLRHRVRTGLIQRDVAARVGVSRGAVQDWEAGLNYPTAERLQALIRALLECGGLTVGQEAAEARALWSAVERESPRMRTPFDEVWFARLLAARAADGQLLASGGEDGTVRLWETGTGQPVATLQGHTCAVWAVRYPPTASVWPAAALMGR